tara:strand:- start:1768 stop:2529 length:762 start_codon:yes stop_codon:yes gene_type:complete
MKITAIIPARMASSRLPGKPLKKINGLSMIEHVRRRVLLCNSISNVIVATCDLEIVDEVRLNNGNAMMTSASHESCVDRVEEVAKNIDTDIIINVQGDMPFVSPSSLEQLIQPMLENETVDYTDMISPIIDHDEIHNNNVVKVVKSIESNSIYYSRLPIPFPLRARNDNVYYKQLGINSFRKKALKRFTDLERTPLEITESIDMLRLIENSQIIRVVEIDEKTVGVDTPEDLRRAINLMSKDELFPKYMDSKN